MKQITRFLLAFIVLALCMPHMEGSSLSTGILLIAIASLAFAIMPVKNKFKLHTNGVQVEVWVKYIVERFFKDNKFLQFAFNDDQYVLAGHVVHIPQPGAKPVVAKNRSSFPAVAVKRTDTDITYVLDEYTTDPSHIPDIDKVELSYSKMDSILGDHMSVLSETVADSLLINWAPAAAQFVPTTGAAVASTGSGQTGNRKGLMPKDLKNAALKMNTLNVPKDNRYALIESNMLDQLTDQLSETQYRTFVDGYDPKNNIIGRWAGFDIMDRSSVLDYDVTNAVKALGAAGAADDNLASLCWQKNSVARAMGDVKMFQDPNNPLYYGDIMSALLRMGGRIRRANAEGIVAIVQTASA